MRYVTEWSLFFSVAVLTVGCASTTGPTGDDVTQTHRRLSAETDASAADEGDAGRSERTPAGTTTDPNSSDSTVLRSYSSESVSSTSERDAAPPIRATGPGTSGGAPRSGPSRASGGPGDSDMPFRATGPVAKVDEMTITADEFNEVVRKKVANSPRELPPALVSGLKGKLVDSLIDKRLLEREIREADISVSRDEVDEEMKGMKERFDSRKAYRTFLKNRGSTEKEMRDKVRKDAKLKKLLEKRNKLDVTDKEARTYFDNNPDEFTEPEMVKARHILIKTDAANRTKAEARRRAAELAEKARSGDESFAELAKQHSDGPSARKGGDLGYFERDRMVESFSKKVFSMKNGEISDPVETTFGFHVIKRIGHKPAESKAFEQVKDDIIDKLEQKKTRKAVETLRKKLRKNADISKNPDNIEMLRKKKSSGN